MSLFLSTETIKKAYETLTSVRFRNQSILHIFLILKGIGIDNLKYNDLNVIKNQGLPYAQDLGSLFSPLEVHPEKNDFINPFMMAAWGSNPTEKLKKWVETRVKNNIVGGATTWRKIIMQDANGDFKFVYDYLNQIYEETIDGHKIPVYALAIWVNRFTKFESKVSLLNLVDGFKKRFHITDEEADKLFDFTRNISRVDYEDEIYDTTAIRRLISGDITVRGWYETTSIGEEIDLVDTELRRFEMSSANNVTKDLLELILNDYKQVILSGPPGTSKSFLCNEIAKQGYEKCVHVQFHPQYTYQQFVGGYIVEKSDVVYKKGIMLDLIELAKVSNDKKYLIIIDEINRANTSQVFGELIQCLDRNTSVEILVDSKLNKYELPENIHIIATMNSTDRTIGAIDYALKRRFLTVYCGCDYSLLSDICECDVDIDLGIFLKKLNERIYNVLQNREMCIGHAWFLKDSYRTSDKFKWDKEKLEVIFNYKILPTIEDYCYGGLDKVNEILGNDLPKRLSGNEFVEAIKRFISQ